MELLLLLLVAGVVGYFLAGSRFSKPIDDTAEKVSQTSKSWADKAGDGWRGRFGKRQQVVDVESRSVEAEPEVKPAEKQPSRRKSAADLARRGGGLADAYDLNRVKRRARVLRKPGQEGCFFDKALDPSPTCGQLVY